MGGWGGVKIGFLKQMAKDGRRGQKYKVFYTRILILYIYSYINIIIDPVLSTVDSNI